MSDFLWSIREKYAEDFGISFTFCQWLSFLLYLLMSRLVFAKNSDGYWGTLLCKSINEIFYGDNSLLLGVRVIDLFLSAAFVLVSIKVYGKARMFIYGFLSGIRDMRGYVDKIKNKLKIESDSKLIRLHMANIAKEQKDSRMKRIQALNGLGFLSLVVFFSSAIGLSSPGVIDLAMLLAGLAAFFLLQWMMFSEYTSQVVPRLILERISREENFTFGEEFY